MNELKNKLNESIYNNEFSTKLIEAESHFENILYECKNEFENGTGSYLFDGKNYKYCIEMYPKQKLLYEKSSKATNILEIGTYMGHSILIMLLANPNAKITCIDIDDKYSLPSVNYLKKKFPYSEINFIKDDSLNILPKLNDKFDFFHIDGSHLNHIIVKEFNYCRKLSKDNKFKLILDDIDSCLKLKNNIELSFTNTNFHIPNCNWKNCYVEIDFSLDIGDLNRQVSKFNKLNLSDFLKEYPGILFKSIRRYPKKIIKNLLRKKLKNN